MINGFLARKLVAVSAAAAAGGGGGGGGGGVRSYKSGGRKAQHPSLLSLFETHTHTHYFLSYPSASSLRGVYKWFVVLSRRKCFTSIQPVRCGH